MIPAFKHPKSKWLLYVYHRGKIKLVRGSFCANPFVFLCVGVFVLVVGKVVLNVGTLSAALDE